jgi:uncharacterized lipoprotein YbaY
MRSTRGIRRRVAVAAGAASVACALAAPAGAQAVSALNIPCTPQQGILFCQGDSAHRAPGWEGKVLLDTNVALPPGGGTNLPLVMLMHGWGGEKVGIDAMKPWADRGYAVLSYTSRGFNGSCGSLAARGIAPPDPTSLSGCAQGWIKLMDTRYEVRDAQNLAGRLADEGLVDGQRVGATGGSYGGGFSMALAALRDRIWDAADNRLKPWTSSSGKPMRIAAAAPGIPWTDLVYSLVPNGRTVDYLLTPTDYTKPGSDGNPVGVLKQSFVAGLFASGEASGYYSPPGVDPGADLHQWYALTNAGEPYDSNPQTQGVVAEIASHHSSFYIDNSRQPAPLFISNGFTDDLFPVDEALRYANGLRARYPASPLKLMFFDWGHMRGANKSPDLARRDAAIFDWFGHYLKQEGPTPANDVTVLTQTCPKSAASGGPFTAATWPDLQPGEVRLSSPAAQTILSGGGDPSVNQAVDPIAGGGNACATTPSGNLGGTATYRFPAAAGNGYTLLGAPTITGKFAVTGPPDTAEIAARLWDVAPNGGPQTLIARGVYRPNGDGSTEVFQLHPNAWRFAPGHQAKLELLANDAPYVRASNGTFSIAATNVVVKLPAHDNPGAANGQVLAPSAPFVPAGGRLAPGLVSFRLRVTYLRAARRARGSRRATSCRWRSARVSVSGRRLAAVRRVDFLVGSRRLARDARGPFAATLAGTRARRTHSRRLRVVATLVDGSRLATSRTLRHC